jgi:uncharacterized protein (TIGR00251 family)
VEPWRYSAQGVLVGVRVTPRGGKDSLDGIEELANGRSVIKVRVRVAAEGGEANRAVAELFADVLHIAKSKVRVVSGVTSRVKQIAIDGDPKALGAALTAATSSGSPNET